MNKKVNNWKNPLPDYVKALLMNTTPTELKSYDRIEICRAGVVIDGKYSDESNEYILASGLYTRYDHKSYILYENDIDTLCIRLFR